VIGAVVLVAVLLLAVPLFMKRPQPSVPATAQQAQSAVTSQTQAQQDEARPETVPTMPRGVAWVLALLIAYGTSVLVFYPCLRMTGRLREDSFGASLQDLSITMLIVYLWSLIPLVGWIIGLIHFMRHYELTCFEMLGILVVATILQSIFLMFVVFPLLFGTGLAPTMMAP
jgi:hypothetical protein